MKMNEEVLQEFRARHGIFTIRIDGAQNLVGYDIGAEAFIQSVLEAKDKEAKVKEVTAVRRFAGWYSGGQGFITQGTVDAYLEQEGILTKEELEKSEFYGVSR